MLGPKKYLIVKDRTQAVDQFLTRTSGLDSNHVNLYINLINALVTAGIWDKLDVLYVLATQDSTNALLNLKSSSFACTLVNAPTFTADRGYAGNGTSSYLATGWNASTNGVNFVLDNALMGVWINATSVDAASANTNMGATDVTQGAIINAWRTVAGIGSRINHVTSTTYGSGIATRLGHSSIQRTASTAVEVFRNGASVATSNTSSSAVANFEVFIGAVNTNGVAAGHLTDRTAVAFAGASLTTAQHAAMDAAFRAYLTAIGGQ